MRGEASLLLWGLADPYVRWLVFCFVLDVVLLAWYLSGHPGERPHVAVAHRHLVAETTVVALLVGGVLFSLASRWAPEPPTSVPTDTTIVGQAAFVVKVVLVGPVWEEVAFRGVLLRALLAKVHAALAVGIAAVLFGAAHVPGGYRLTGFLGTATIGAIYCWLFVRTRSVWPGVAVHSAVNAVVLLPPSGLRAAVLLPLVAYATRRPAVWLYAGGCGLSRRCG